MTESERDLADAVEIQNRGWRQGSVLDPRTTTVAFPLDHRLEHDEFFVLYTQSCTVVSRRFSTDPKVELIVAKLISKYKGKSPEATGKNQRKLHVAYSDGSAALEFDFNRRFSIDRRLLLDFHPAEGMIIGEIGALKLGAWIGRAYTRIALPDALVENMRKKGGLIDSLKKALDTPYGEEADPVHFEVPFIYINWQPRNNESENFSLNFQFICNEYGAAEVLDESITLLLEKYSEKPEYRGIDFIQWSCKPANETFLTDLDGYERLSEWDYLSNLADTTDLRS